MKKLLIVAALLVASSFVFANESIFDNFWNNGKFVKFVENGKITYTNKSIISNIEVEGDDIRIVTVAYGTRTRANWTYDTYNTKKWDVSSDDNANIVLKKK